MARVGTLQAGMRHPGVTELERGHLVKTTLLQSPEGQWPSPHAYLIEQSPNSFARAHFHHNSEFQVVVGGAGQLGRHDVAPYTVHYAGQQTGYGPIVAGADGLTYLTMRPVTEFGIWYLPESRAYMDPQIRRGQELSSHLQPASEQQLSTLHAASIQVAIEPKPSGLAVWRVQAGPGADIPSPVHDNGAGRFWMVAGGSVRHASAELPLLSTMWVSKDEPVPNAVAGEKGADVLVLQFPANAWEFPNPPVR